MTRFDPLQREPGGLYGCEYPNVKSFDVVIRQIRVDLLDQLRVVGPVFIEPEYRGRTGSPRSIYGELYPVLNGRVFNLAHAEDVASFDRLLNQNVIIRIHNADTSGTG